MNSYEVAYNLAAAIVNHAEIQALSNEFFGQEIKVYMDSLGTLDHLDVIDDNLSEDEKIIATKNAVYPLLIISGVAETGGEVAEGETFEVAARLLVDASMAKDGTDVDSSKCIRDEKGVFIYARSGNLAKLVEKITDELRDIKAGAIYQDYSITNELGESYPIQYSEFTVNYKSYQAFKTF